MATCPQCGKQMDIDGYCWKCREYKNPNDNTKPMYGDKPKNYEIHDEY